MGNTLGSKRQCIRKESRTGFALEASKYTEVKRGKTAAKRGNQMTQQAQLASDPATKDAQNAAVVLESRNLKKIYGRGEKAISVLADASLSLRRGEMVAI